jgi:sortase A
MKARALLSTALTVGALALATGACGDDGDAAPETTVRGTTTTRVDVATTLADRAADTAAPATAAPATTAVTTTAPDATDVATTVAPESTVVDSTSAPATTAPTTIVAAPAPRPAATAPPAPAEVPATVASAGALPQPISPPPPRSKEQHVEVGTIEIPKIGVSKTLLEGISLNTLDKAPGHWPGTAMPGQPGNVVVAGHRSSKDRPFRHIDQLVPGDEVIMTTGDGRFVYVVTGTQIVLPDAMWIVGQTPDSTATLFACHPVGSTRERIVVFLQLQA